MIAEAFLKDYFSIVLFLVIAIILSCGFILLNFALSPKILIQRNYHPTNVDLNHLTTPEWSLILDFI